MAHRRGNDGIDERLLEYRLTNDAHRLFGFFFGSTLTGAGIYYYVLDEYKLSNELLTEDIYVSIASSPDAASLSTPHAHIRRAFQDQKLTSFHRPFNPQYRESTNMFKHWRRRSTSSRSTESKRNSRHGNKQIAGRQCFERK